MRFYLCFAIVTRSVAFLLPPHHLAFSSKLQDAAPHGGAVQQRPLYSSSDDYLNNLPPASTGATGDYLDEIGRQSGEGTPPPGAAESYLTDLDRKTAEAAEDAKEVATPATEPIGEPSEGRFDGKKILVFGATGKTGKRVVMALVGEGANVVAGVRSREKASAELGDAREGLQFLGVDVVCGKELAGAVRGCDAVVIATGFTPSFPPDPLGPLKVDYLGTRRVIDACVDAQVPKLVMISSLLTNGLAAGQGLNPNYLLLNAFGGVLLLKRKAEMYLENQAFLDWTIVRPGGLKNSPPVGNIVFASRDTLFSGAISREQVARVVVEAIVEPAASRKIVEIVARESAPYVGFAAGFESVE